MIDLHLLYALDAAWRIFSTFVPILISGLGYRFGLGLNILRAWRWRFFNHMDPRISLLGTWFGDGSGQRAHGSAYTPLLLVPFEQLGLLEK
jgi:hypothetical protein